MASEGTQFESIVAHLDQIADLLACDGIGVWIDGRAALKGLTPTEEEFAGLVAFRTPRTCSEVFARHDIGAEFPPARAFAERAAGMLVVPLSRPSRDYLVFFRKEDGAQRQLGGRSLQAGHGRAPRRPPDPA